MPGYLYWRRRQHWLRLLLALEMISLMLLTVGGVLYQNWVNSHGWQI